MKTTRRFLQLTMFQLILLTIIAARTLAECADSVWLDYQEGLATSGDVIMTDMQVEATALYTYYAGLVWNNGYMGLQRGGGNGYYKHVHFSVWDPPVGGFAELIWSDRGVVVERFGGEETGWKAMWPFNWLENTDGSQSPNQPYRVRTVCHCSVADSALAVVFSRVDNGPASMAARPTASDGIEQMGRGI